MKTMTLITDLAVPALIGLVSAFVVIAIVAFSWTTMREHSPVQNAGAVHAPAATTGTGPRGEK